MITGKATDADELLMEDSSNAKLTIEKTRYLCMLLNSKNIQALWHLAYPHNRGVPSASTARCYFFSLLGISFDFQISGTKIATAITSRKQEVPIMQTAHRVAQQAVVVSAAYAILMALIGHFFGEKIVSFITSDPEIIRLGTMYLRIEFIGGATVTLRMMMDAIMQASGDSINPMWIAITYRLFHIALCPFLIFGW